MVVVGGFEVGGGSLLELGGGGGCVVGVLDDPITRTLARLSGNAMFSPREPMRTERPGRPGFDTAPVGVGVGVGLALAAMAGTATSDAARPTSATVRRIVRAPTRSTFRMPSLRRSRHPRRLLAMRFLRLASCEFSRYSHGRCRRVHSPPLINVGRKGARGGWARLVGALVRVAEWQTR